MSSEGVLTTLMGSFEESTGSLEESPAESQRKIRRLNPAENTGEGADSSLDVSTASLSESRFEDYLARYTVVPSDFGEFFNNNNNACSNNKFENKNNNSGDETTDSDTESAIDAKVERAARTLHEIFVEGCCALYSDLRDALDDLERAPTPLTVIGFRPDHFHHGGTKAIAGTNTVATTDEEEVEEPAAEARQQCSDELADRLRMLTRQAGELGANVPALADTAQLRLATLERAMQQLRIRQQQHQQQQHHRQQHQNRPNGREGVGGGGADSQRFRKWLQTSECELSALKRRVADAPSDLARLQRFRADHQVLQLQIETEGRALLNSAYQELHLERQAIQSIGETPVESADCSPATVTALLARAEKRLDRWHRNLEVLEHRWYTHWLASLEGLEVVERLLDRLSESEHSSCCSQSESDTDGEEPLCKRLKSSLSPPPKVATHPEIPSAERNCGKRNALRTTAPSNNFRENRLSDVDGVATKMVTSELKSDLLYSSISQPILRRDVAVTITSASSGIDEDGATDHLTTATSDVEYEDEKDSKLLAYEKLPIDGKILLPIDATVRNVATGPLSSVSVTLSSVIDGGCNGCGSRASSSSSNGAPTSHDVGYSSGENNSLIDGADTTALAATGDETATNDALNGCLENSIVKSYYRTVPLDDAGATDTEYGRQLVPSLLAPGDNSSHLTDSLIVQVDNNNSFNQPNHNSDLNKPLDDFEEVMEMMDEQFQTQLELLRRGTQWRELRASGMNTSRRNTSGGGSGGRSPKHRSVVPPASSRLNATYSRKTTAGSCDASSEESDCNRQSLLNFRNAHSLTSSLCCPAENSSSPMPFAENFAPTIVVEGAKDDDELPTDLTLKVMSPPRRKRYHRRSSRNPENKPNHNMNGFGVSTTVVVSVPTCSVPGPAQPANNAQQMFSRLKDVLMDQSVYVTGNSDAERSQEDELPFQANPPSGQQCGLSLYSSPAARRMETGHRKVARRRMHRSASDNAALCNAITFGQAPNKMSVSTYEGQQQQHHHHYHHHHHFYEEQQNRRQSCCHCRCQCQTSSEKCHNLLVRTCSVESCQSSSSSTTIHESEDAHFEWDEYKDLCDLVMPPSRREFEEGLAYDSRNHSTPKRPQHEKSNNGINNNGSASVSILDPESLIFAEDEAFFADGATDDVQYITYSDSKDAPPSARVALLKESRAQLRGIQNMLRGVRAGLAAARRRKHGARVHIDKLVQASATAAENLQQLHAHVRDATPTDMEQISELEVLREGWTRTLNKITRMLNRYEGSERGNSLSGDDVSRPSTSHSHNSNENNVEDCDNKKGEEVSLHVVLEEMKAQLDRLMKCDGGATAPLSIADIEAVVCTRKEILGSLLQYRDDLRELTAVAKRRAHRDTAPAGALNRSDVLELMTLMELVEKSLHSIQSSTISLERLREDFSALCALFLSLDTKIDRLNSSVAPATDADAPTACTAFAKTIESELELCQERMDALETVCNTLSSHLALARPFADRTIEPGVITLTEFDLAAPSDEMIPAEPHPPIGELRDSDVEAADFQMLSEFSQFRSKLNQLKERFQKAVEQQETTRLSGSPTATRKRRLDTGKDAATDDSGSDRGPSSRSHSSTSISTDAPADAPPALAAATVATTPPTTVADVGTQSDINAETVRVYEERLSAAKAARRAAAVAASEPGGDLKRRRRPASPPAAHRISQKLRAALHDSRLAQLCLGCALALTIGMILLQAFGLRDEGRHPMLANTYRWSFGPQLDYRAGPPPR